jgi:hypothetical protein
VAVDEEARQFWQNLDAFTGQTGGYTFAIRSLAGPSYF